jgi:hypothetical protein
MKYYFFIINLFIISNLWIGSISLAANCTICGEEAQGTPSLVCQAGHEIHGECIAHQMNSTEITSQEQAKEIREHGLRCYGNEEKCGEKISLSTAEDLLNESQELKDLKKRLSSAESCTDLDGSPCGTTSSSSNSGLVVDLQDKNITQFKNKILEAFNLCCPNSECNGILAPVEGCNAATCESCTTKFCYLCLQRQAGFMASHAHARAHSGDYWEHRDGHTGLVPGRGQDYQEFEEYEVQENSFIHGKRIVKLKKAYKYTDRYHWEIVREKLESLFEKENDPEVKEKAVKALEPFLKKNKMWPVPVGKNINEWVSELNGDLSIDSNNRIALLQNELVYVTEKQKHGLSEKAKSEDSVRVKSLNDALLNLNAPALRSLNVNSYHASQLDLEQAITLLFEGNEDERMNALYVQLRDEVPLHPGGSRFFDLGGNAGRISLITDPERAIAPFIFSDSAPRVMNYWEAFGWDENGVHRPGYCESLGARLPTQNELKALGRAMSVNGPYDPNAIEDMLGLVWSASVPHYFSSTFAFVFSHGLTYPYFKFVQITVRCVRDVP